MTSPRIFRCQTCMIYVPSRYKAAEIWLDLPIDHQYSPQLNRSQKPPNRFRRGNNLKYFKDMYLKAKAESGLDCRVRATFARKR
jgi:hypothetical protein